VVEVNLQGAGVDMKLAFANVSFVLEIGVVDAAALSVLLYLGAFDAKNLDAVREEQAVVKHVELGPLDLLYVAVEFVLRPVRERYHSLPCGCFFDATEDGLLSDCLLGLFLHYGEFDLNSKAQRVVIEVVEQASACGTVQQALHHALCDGTEPARSQGEDAIPKFLAIHSASSDNR
jgi:hypothetical protein